MKTESDLKQTTVSSIGWTLLSQGGTQLIQFVLLAILGWLLSPHDFGLVGMLLVFTGFAKVFTDFGFGSAIIQFETIEERHYSSVFYLNLAVGLALTLLLFFLAPLLGKFYNELSLVPLTQLVSVNFALGSLTIIQRAKLVREMNFKKLGSIEVAAVFISGIAAVFLALNGWGPYTLVAQLIMINLATIILMWVFCRWHPKLLFEKRAIKELFGFSSNLLGSNMLNYWMRNVDNLLIGKFVGADALGLYGRAYTTMLLPINQVGRVLTRVMFPAFSKIQNDPARVKRIYLRVTQTIVLVVFPMMLGLFIVAEEFVLTVYGPKWTGVIPLLQILCFVGMVQALNTTTGWIYTSQGRTDIQFRWVLFGSILTLIAFAIGIQWGAMGVAIAYVIRVYSTLYLVFSIPGKLIGMTFMDVAKKVSPILFCSLVMVAVVWLCQQIIPVHLHSAIRLLILVSVGILSYLLVIHLAALEGYRELKQLIGQQIVRRSSAKQCKQT